MLPAPPAQIQTLPAPSRSGRELAFAGFNRFPLKGTILEAQGSPFFAVLAADSGPLDRNWSGPRLPGHAGQAVAEWLRDQGIGSLRFDKRLFGSRDPQLDTSLDAQAGDLKAALATLKDLPEARGRKILLVGHGEGALLALVASIDADALLLLGMPCQTMAQSLTAQVTAQLPAEQAAPNLAYLAKALQAIRTRAATPKPGPDVLPALGRFCVSLMAPETLEFVRATLDLDPWAMASRTAMQAWKPLTAPPAFHGTLLEIPGANHFFKRETRPRGELTPASALAGYGDDTPLADLSPIAAWLKALK